MYIYIYIYRSIPKPRLCPLRARLSTIQKTPRLQKEDLFGTSNMPFCWKKVTFAQKRGVKSLSLCFYCLFSSNKSSRHPKTLVEDRPPKSSIKVTKDSKARHRRPKKICLFERFFGHCLSGRRCERPSKTRRTSVLNFVLFSWWWLFVFWLLLHVIRRTDHGQESLTPQLGDKTQEESESRDSIHPAGQFESRSRSNF